MNFQVFRFFLSKTFHDFFSGCEKRHDKWDKRVIYDYTLLKILKFDEKISE